MNKDIENNLECDTQNNLGCDMNIDKNFWEKIRDLTMKQALIYFLIFAAASFMLLLGAFIKLSREQAICVVFGMIISLFVLVVFLLFKLFKANSNSTVKFSRKPFMFFLIEAVITFLFKVLPIDGRTAKNRFLFMEIQLIIGIVVAIFIALLPKYPPDRNIIEISKKKIIFFFLGDFTLILIFICLAIFAGNSPDTVTSEISNRKI